MKALAALALLVAMFGVGSARAADLHRVRTHIDFGFVFGVPYPWGWYYPPAYYPPYHYPRYYYYPPAPYGWAPPVYVEQATPPAAQPSAQPAYWYYCRDPAGYYPYVKECKGQWEPVSPQPTTPPARR